MGRIIGAHIVLREFRQEDISGIRSWVTDEESTRRLGAAYRCPQSWEQSERYLSGLLEGEAGGVHFAVADKESLRYLGQVSLMMIDTVAHHAELAIVLCPDSANRGFGTEAVQLALHYAFEQINLHRVYLKVWADHVRAIRCYEKCGFRREGILRAHTYADGEYQDVLCMGILRHELGKESR